jgi:integrase/recombinase XerC
MRLIIAGGCSPNYLGILKNNVFKVSMRLPTIIKTEQTKYLTLAAWRYLWSYLQRQGGDSLESHLKAARNRWMFALLYHTGIRRENLVGSRMGDFVCRDGDWVLRIIAKGRKELFVTINSMLLEELTLFRRMLGLTPLPSPDETLPVLPKLRGDKTFASMSTRNVGLIVERVTQGAAANCEDPQIRSQLQAMTTHWMRHTNGTHRMIAGASLETTRQEFGHTDLNTTLIYAKASSKAHRQDAERLGKLME